jgi:hypothetical protein
MLRRLLLLLALVLPGGPALAQGDPSFNLVNRSGQTINEIYVSPVAEQFWGRDLLGADVLPDGRAFPVRIPSSAGCRQDVRVVYADGRAEQRRDVDTCRIAEMVFGAGAPPRTGAAGGAAAGAANPSFNLVNHGRVAIREVYVSSARETHWGEDRLGADILPPGRHLEVRLPLNDCVNDVRVVWMDGRREDRRGQDTCRVVNMVFQ